LEGITQGRTTKKTNHKRIKTKTKMTHRIMFKPPIELLERMKKLKAEKERYPDIPWTYQSMTEIALREFLAIRDKETQNEISKKL